MLALIDNYDSFTWNLVHYLEALGERPRVFRNNQITLAELDALAPERIVISPGPGAPADAGISCDVIRAFAGRVPVLGVCLGHQCLAEVFGGRVVPAGEPVHGKTSRVRHAQRPPFEQLPSPLSAMRYHSLIVAPASLPHELEVTAQTETGEIMGLLHREFTLLGVQFHPESILTEHGMALLRNFLRIPGGRWHA